MLLNSIGCACSPVLEASPEFKQSVLVPEERVIYDSKGKVVSREIVDVSRVQPIPHKEFENEGITSDMFGVEVQQRAGVQLHEFSSDFYGVSLDFREFYENAVESQLSAFESEMKQNNDTIKFD